jgi:Ser/Thr protein kinase RdoA (MazF antagonist)
VHHPLTAERLAVATELLGRGAPAAVEPFGGEYAPVTRLRYRDGTSVVVKTRRVEGAGWGGPHHLRRELVALSLLDGLGVDVAPSVLAADEAAGVVVMRDLGADRPTLEAQLLGDDPDAAAAAMVGLGATAGRLHAATASAEVEDEHRRRLSALGTDAGRDRHGLWPGARQWQDVVNATRALGLPDAALAADDVAEVAAAEAEPGAAGALVHLDLNPRNAVVGEDGVVRLVDFEGSTFGHAGLDAGFLHYPFPNYSQHWAVLPDEVVAAADGAYRTAFPALDDRLLAVGAAALFAIRVQRLPVLAAEGQSPHDSWRRRAQLVQQADVLVRLCERADALPGLVRWVRALRAAMAARWPDATDPPPPVFPAFSSRAAARRRR